MNEKTVATWEWFYCPNCGWKLCKVSKGVHISGVIVWCKKCKNEVEVKRTA